jgi:hypothetical protein
MAFKGVFKYKSKEYRLINFTHTVERTLDNRGAPSSGVVAGIISVTIEVGDNNDIAAWAMLDYQADEGEIVLYKRDSDATLRSLNFSDAYIFYYQEAFSADDSTPSTFTFSITARVVDLTPDGVEGTARWA